MLSADDFDELRTCDEFSPPDMLKDGWEHLTNEPTVQGFARDFADSGLKQIRATAVCFGARPEQVFNCIWDFDLSRKWGDAWDESIIIEQVDPLNECIYLRAPLPSGVTLRDFVQFRGCQFDRAVDPNFCLILFRNAAHPKYPLEYTAKRGYIRGETLGIIGYSVRAIPIPAGTSPDVFANRERIACRVSITTCFDLKGLIPRWLVNWVAGKAPITWAVNLQKAVDKGLGKQTDNSPLNAQPVPNVLVLKPAAADASVGAATAAASAEYPSTVPVRRISRPNQ